jgi:phage terminase large subunit-like protein
MMGIRGWHATCDNAVLKESAARSAYITKEDKASPKKIDAAIAAVIAWNRSCVALL